MNNANCMNICLGNELLTEIDKYASILGVSRESAIHRLIIMMRTDRYVYPEYPFTVIYGDESR